MGVLGWHWQNLMSHYNHWVVGVGVGDTFRGAASQHRRRGLLLARISLRGEGANLSSSILAMETQMGFVGRSAPEVENIFRHSPSQRGDAYTDTRFPPSFRSYESVLCSTESGRIFF